jgi:hypothetical protein
MKKLSYEQVISGKRFDSYSKEAEYILSLIDKGRIKPIISSAKNGKHPALYTRYWLLEEEKEYTELIDELRNFVSSMIDIDYYLKHIKVYEKEREYVKKTKEVINEIEREFINGDYEIEKIPLIKTQKESGMLRKKLIIINYGDEKKAEEKENQGLNKIKETEDVKAQVEKVKDFYEIFFKEFEIYRELMRIIGNPKLKLKEFCLFSKNYPNI